jgi:hypothetical protein
MTRKFDFIAIGTGSAASGVTSRCREAGWEVAIVDSRPFGSTCALRGCDPRKVLVGAAFEFAYVAALAGSQVAVLLRGPRPLTPFGPDLVDQLVERTRELGIELHLETEATGIEKVPSQLIVRALASGPDCRQTNRSARSGIFRNVPNPWPIPAGTHWGFVGVASGTRLELGSGDLSSGASLYPLSTRACPLNMWYLLKVESSSIVSKGA